MAEDPYDVFVPTKERIAAPFTREAMNYVALGWFPVPVKGKGMVPKGVTGAQGVVNKEKVEKQLISRDRGYDNLGVRHDGTIAIDVDVRGEKKGNDTLEEFRRVHNLSPLPATPSSTARGDDDHGRQYFFRLPEYVRLDHKPKINGHDIEGVEICQLHHRFSVVYPSQHPDIVDADPTYYWYTPGTGGLTWGEKTLTIPRVEDLPFLPADWIEALTHNVDSDLDLDADVTDAQSLVSSFRDGEPSTPVRTALEEAQTQHPGHDETYNSLFKAFRYGREGHPGVKQLVATIVARHRYYLETGFPERLAKGEVEAIVRDAATKAQQKPIENPYRPYSPLITLNGSAISVGPGVSGGMAEESKPLVTLGSGVFKRPAQSTQQSATDWDAALDAGMLADDITSGSTTFHVLPAWVWEQSVELAKIKRAALCRQVSPDVVLHAILATLSSLVHHETTLHTGKKPTQLSYYAAAVGPSGTGKTEGMSCAHELIETWRNGQIEQLGTDGYKRAEVGSGEGMVEAFMGEVSEFTPKLDEEGEPLIDDETGEAIGKWSKVRKQVRHNALFVSDEGRQLLALASRSGSTVMSTLCSMWSGESAGASNAKAENSRIIDKGGYVLGMLMGFQPATMDDLFADSGGGAPQRFLFASAVHPDITAEFIDWPGELAPKLPPWAPIKMELSDKHKMIVRQYNADKGNGIIEENPLDGHRMLLQCKVAGLLALLHSQTFVSDEMWDLAKVVVDTSCDYRDDLAGRAQRQAQEAAERKAQMQVKTTVTSAVMVEENVKLNAAVDAIVDKLGSAPNGELTKRDLRSMLTGSMRVADVFNPAVERAVAQGRIVVDDVMNPSTNRKVTIFRLTDTED